MGKWRLIVPYVRPCVIRMKDIVSGTVRHRLTGKMKKDKKEEGISSLIQADPIILNHVFLGYQIIKVNGVSLIALEKKIILC